MVDLGKRDIADIYELGKGEPKIHTFILTQKKGVKMDSFDC